MTLTPEERQQIYEEEKARLEEVKAQQDAERLVREQEKEVERVRNKARFDTKRKAFFASAVGRNLCLVFWSVVILCSFLAYQEISFQVSFENNIRPYLVTLEKAALTVSVKEGILGSGVYHSTTGSPRLFLYLAYSKGQVSKAEFEKWYPVVNDGYYFPENASLSLSSRAKVAKARHRFVDRLHENKKLSEEEYAALKAIEDSEMISDLDVIKALQKCKMASDVKLYSRMLEELHKLLSTNGLTHASYLALMHKAYDEFERSSGPEQRWLAVTQAHRDRNNPDRPPDYKFPDSTGLTDAQIEVAMREFVGSNLFLIGWADKFDQPTLQAELYK